MPRKRTPSPEQQLQDNQIVAGAAFTLRAVAARHSNDRLALAAEVADAFAAAPVRTTQPKPRTRKPKAQPDLDAMMRAREKATV